MSWNVLQPYLFWGGVIKTPANDRNYNAYFNEIHRIIHDMCVSIIPENISAKNSAGNVLEILIEKNILTKR